MAEAWIHFEDVALARGGTGFGFAPISAVELRAWAALTRTRLRPWHVRAMRALDVTFLGIMGVEDKTLDFQALADGTVPHGHRGAGAQG